MFNHSKPHSNCNSNSWYRNYICILYMAWSSLYSAFVLIHTHMHMSAPTPPHTHTHTHLVTTNLVATVSCSELGKPQYSRQYKMCLSLADHDGNKQGREIWRNQAVQLASFPSKFYMCFIWSKIPRDVPEASGLILEKGWQKLPEQFNSTAQMVVVVGRKVAWT